jgi:hypothetical protein
MDKAIKRVFFWGTFLIGIFFILWSYQLHRNSTAMIAFATGISFVMISVIVVIFGDMFVTKIPEASPPSRARPLLLSYEDSPHIEKEVVMLDGVLSLKNKNTQKSSSPEEHLFSRSYPKNLLPSQTVLEEGFGSSAFESVQSSWTDLPCTSKNLFR